MHETHYVCMFLSLYTSSCKITWYLEHLKCQIAHLHGGCLSHTNVHQRYALGVPRKANNGATVHTLQVGVAADMIVVMVCVEDVVQRP